MAAMANGEGGTLLLHLDVGGGSSGGEAAVEKARDAVLQAALLCDPPLIIPLPKPVSLDEDQQWLWVEIPRGLPHVYALEGKYLQRMGAQNAPLSPPQVRRLLFARGEAGFESQPLGGASVDDLDELKIVRYLRSVPALDALPVQEALLKRGCLVERDGGLRPTIAGLLLFAADVDRFVHSQVMVVRYAGREMSDEFVREEIRDTLPEQVQRAESAVLANLRTGARIDSLQRDEHLEYPVKAVREAIVNAVAHRDYSLRGDDIRISIFTDRIEFYSPGRLPGHVTVQNIVDERFSRNQVLVQILSDMGFIERLGYGIDRMIKLMADDGLPLPQFRETANGFVVTLYGPGEDFVSGSTSLRRQWRLMGLNERQIAALEYLGEHGRITNREYQTLSPGVSSETIRRDLADLVSRDLLLKIGKKRATYYIFK
jgi:ATP-dependent DNA helicase RecG